MDPSINPAPPPDPTVSRVKGPLADARREQLLGEELPIDSDSIADLGSTVLDGTDVVVIWEADSEVAEPEVHEPGFEFNPTDGLSLDTFTEGSGLTYARAFVETLATGKAKVYKKGTEGERVVEGVIRDDDGNATHLVVSRMVGREVTGKKKETSTLPVTELEESIARASDKIGFVIEPQSPEMAIPDLPYLHYPKSPETSTEAKQTKEHQIEEVIKQNIAYLRGLKSAKGEVFSDALGGGDATRNSENAPLEGAVAELHRRGIVKRNNRLERRPNNGITGRNGTGSEGAFVRIGEDPIYVSASEQLDKYKLYLSLGSSEGDISRRSDQQKFLVDLVEKAVEAGIDIAWKTLDHEYDQPCIYTRKPNELAQLLSKLYESGDYPKSIWNNVDRHFQTPIKGVSNKHAGIVQEPSGGWNGSHSSRMLKFGRELDSLGEITEETYREAARRVGVRPEEPGLLDDNARSAYMSQWSDPVNI